MKKIFLIFGFILLINNCYTQTFISDINKTKKELSILTELFIEEQCINDCKVIANIIDDTTKIMLSCVLNQNVYCNLNDTRYTYSYLLTFELANKKYTINIDNIKCISVYNNCKCIDLNDEFNLTYGLDKESFDKLKINLANEIQNKINKYILFLNNN